NRVVAWTYSQLSARGGVSISAFAFGSRASDSSRTGGSDVRSALALEWNKGSGDSASSRQQEDSRSASANGSRGFVVRGVSGSGSLRREPARRQYRNPRSPACEANRS